MSAKQSFRDKIDYDGTPRCDLFGCESPQGGHWLVWYGGTLDLDNNQAVVKRCKAIDERRVNNDGCQEAGGRK